MIGNALSSLLGILIARDAAFVVMIDVKRRGQIDERTCLGKGKGGEEFVLVVDARKEAHLLFLQITASPEITHHTADDVVAAEIVGATVVMTVMRMMLMVVGAALTGGVLTDDLDAHDVVGERSKEVDGEVGFRSE